MSNLFRRVGGLVPGKSVFDLSYEKKFTGDMGLLYPIVADEMVPGDTFEIGNEVVIRFQPMVAPMLHQVDVYIHYFFVPYRLLWDEWEDFITGGESGDLTPVIPEYDPYSKGNGKFVPSFEGNAKYTLWDYFGFPVGVNLPVGQRPLSFPWRAYNLVWNEYYRDQNVMDEVNLDQPAVLRRCWKKDYFTSALPWQQRGLAPALPISGVTSAEWPSSSVGVSTAAYNLQFSPYPNDNSAFINNSGARDNVLGFLGKNTVDLSVASTFDIADLRLAFQIQKFLERNARAGARYTEFLGAHFGVAPRDERLQRPEYVGGMKTGVVVSEVLQTSETSANSPQGNLAGHAIVADKGYIAKYHATEFGVIIGLLSVMPKAAYQQGVNKQWLRKTKYDFYFPEFAHLSEQPIKRIQLYATDNEIENDTIFGYQGIYDEMRVKYDMVCADMRDTFDYWHLGRKFASPPALNQDFLLCNPSKRIFAVQDEPGMIISVGNIIKAIRPLPAMAEPGLIDHF